MDSTPRKEKKRVGFSGSNSQAGAFSPASQSSDYPSAPPSPGAPDAHELSRRLSRILSGEEHRAGHSEEKPTPVLDDRDGHLTVPTSRPRPALRRGTSYDPAVSPGGDQAAGGSQLKSERAARKRASELAASVVSYSAPASRRASVEIRPVGEGETRAETSGRDEPREKPDETSIRRRRPENEHHEAAEKLVQSHVRRGRFDYLHSRLSLPSSGTSTPTTRRNSFDDAPKPSAYRGGILSTLLKLYNDEKRGGSGSGSATPTPADTPESTPPSSRRQSFASNPGSRPQSGIFKNFRHSTSSLALTELMKSSSMIAAPGSADISGRVAERLKQEKLPPRGKKDQVRITKHIAAIISRHRYLMKLCRALMLFGAPTHRLEEYMTMSARVLEIQAQFLYIPGCMLISFDDTATHTTEVKLVRATQGLDLGRLRDVHSIYKEVVHDDLGAEEASARLDEIMGRAPKFKTWVRIPMYGLASACVAPFAFEGRLIDLPIAFVLGCIVGVLQLVIARRNELYAHVFEVTCAVITSFLARALGSVRGGGLFCFSALAQSSIALILPGYLVLCSSLELQSRNMVAGSVRMVYAMIYTLFLGYGITIGASLYGIVDGNATSNIHCDKPIPQNFHVIFVACFTMCLCIINQAKWKQTPVMLVMALAGYLVNNYISKLVIGNSQISTMMGALAVGCLANLYSRLGPHVDSAMHLLLERWSARVSRLRGPASPGDAERGESSSARKESEAPPAPRKNKHRSGYWLAAAAMLPAIFVLVPSGLAAGGSLLAGVTSADQITGNVTGTQPPSPIDVSVDLEGTAFNVLMSVIQVAIGISVGLFMSVLLVYPLGKRRSGILSF